MKYRLDACPAVWQLRAEQEANGDSVVLQEWPVESVQGTQIKPQIVVDGEVRVAG